MNHSPAWPPVRGGRRAILFFGVNLDKGVSMVGQLTPLMPSGNPTRARSRAILPRSGRSEGDWLYRATIVTPAASQLRYHLAYEYKGKRRGSVGRKTTGPILDSRRAVGLPRIRCSPHRCRASLPTVQRLPTHRRRWICKGARPMPGPTELAANARRPETSGSVFVCVASRSNPSASNTESFAQKRRIQCAT